MNKRQLFFVILTVLVLALASLLFFKLIGQGKVLDITVAPKDAVIILDNNKKIKNGKLKIPPGKHEIIVKRNGFQQTTKTFHTNPDGKTQVWVSLSPNTPEGEEYIKDHQREFLEVESMASEEYNQNANQLVEKYPLLSQLPIDSSPLFRIDYGVSKKYPNDNQKIAIYISSPNANGRQLALQTISDSGYDLSDYEIIFQGLE